MLQMLTMLCLIAGNLNDFKYFFLCLLYFKKIIYHEYLLLFKSKSR